jgi:hypothetical protein
VERHLGLDALPLSIDSSVVTVGFFDGVHLGHRAVLATTVAAARERGVPAVAVTFDRHPREVLTPGEEPRLLTTVERKASLLAEVGVDVLVVLEFTEVRATAPGGSQPTSSNVGCARALRGGRAVRSSGEGNVGSDRGVRRSSGRAGGAAGLDERTVSSSSVESLAGGDLDGRTGLSAASSWTERRERRRSRPGPRVPGATCGRRRDCSCRPGIYMRPRDGRRARRGDRRPPNTFGPSPTSVVPLG